MTTQTQSHDNSDLKVLAGILFGLSLLLIPPVYSKLFSILPLIQGDEALLIALIIFLNSFSMGLILGYERIRAKKFLKGVLLTFIFLLGFELFFRLLVNRFFPRWRKEIATHGMVALPAQWRYQGHPFLQFVGNPKYLFDLNWVNKNGYYYSEVPFEKKKGEVRVVCMGGSTTRDFPQAMRFSNPNTKVMNFSLDAYTPAHSLINFQLNAIPYNPDYVVFHHTPTPAFEREDGKLVMDYRDTLKSFTVIQPPDVFFIRTSILYTELRNLLFPLGDWYFFRSSVILMPQSFDFANVKKEQLFPFQREVKSFIDLAKGRNIRLVLTTHPHQNKKEIQYVAMGNQIIRELHQENLGSTILVDLDLELSQKYPAYFEDEVHFNNEGNQLKANLIAQAIELDLQKYKAH